MDRLVTYTDLPTGIDIKARQAQELLAVLEPWQIQDSEGADQAGLLLQEVHAEIKELDRLRLEVGKPAREAQRDINNYFAPALAAYGKAKTILKSRIDAYRRAQVEAQTRAYQALAQGQRAVVPSAEVQGTTTRSEVRIEILDIDAIPREYLCVDWSALKILAKSGGDPPPGVAFHREERTVVK